MQITKFAAGTAIALALALPAAAQEAAAPAPTDAATVVATVNGTEITVGHMIILKSQLPPQYQQIPDAQLFEGILEQLIQQTALAQTVGSLDAVDEMVIENDRRSYVAGVALRRAAAETLTDEAVQRMYDERFADALPTTEYNAAHILVPTIEEAQAIKAAIDGGADFAEQAREHSTDGAAQAGGALGWFSAGMMVPDFESAVMALEVGQVSEPVETQFGWHVVKLNETREQPVPTLDEVRAEIESAVQQAMVTDLVEKVVGEAEVTRSVEGIDPGVLSDQTILDN